MISLATPQRRTEHFVMRVMPMVLPRLSTILRNSLTERWRSDMWLVSKKKYDALLEQKKDFERIATNAVAQNDRLLEEWNAAIQEKRDLRESNLRLAEYNDELLAHCKELEAKLVLVTEHIQLADGTIFAIEEALYRQKGDNVIQLHIDEYYEEVKLLDTK
jgi:hypothetical protein